MSNGFSIKSTVSNREFVFSKYTGEDFNIELRGSVETSLKIYGYSPHSNNLASWFAELGQYNVPWEKEKIWESLEGEFKISAVCSKLGQVYFVILLRKNTGTAEEAIMNVGLETEFGQIAHIIIGARKFFEK